MATTAPAAPTTDNYEQAARTRARALEAAGKLPHGFVETYYPLTPAERLELRRLQVIWDLAGDVEALRDLLHGVPVPPSRLNPQALAEAQNESLVQLVKPIDLIRTAA